MMALTLLLSGILGHLAGGRAPAGPTGAKTLFEDRAGYVSPASETMSLVSWETRRPLGS